MTSEPVIRYSTAAERSRALHLVRLAAVAALGLPVLISLVISLVHLFGVRWPDAADSSQLDGTALFRGNAIYQSPDAGYTGTTYTPLLALIVSVLDRIWEWRGWGAAVSLVAGLVLICVCARLITRDSREQRLWQVTTVVEALLVGALVIWLTPGDWIFWSDRPDVFSWVLALGGLATLCGGQPTRRRLAATVFLLTAAFWAKQTAIVAAVAAVVWVLIGIFLRWLPRKWGIGFIGALVLLNGGLLSLANLLTRGWEWQFNFVIPSNQPCCELGDTVRAYISVWSQSFFFGAFWAFVFTFVLVGATLAARGRRGLASLGASSRGRSAILFMLFIAIALPAAAVARRNLGSASNQDVGALWGIVLLGMVVYPLARRRLSSELAVTAMLVLLVVAAYSIPTFQLARWQIYAAPSTVGPKWSAIDPTVVAFDTTRLVYDPIFPDLSSGRSGAMYPGWITMTGLLGAGRHSLYLEHALRRRHFDAVFPFPEGAVDHPLVNKAHDAEAGYLWKLNEVMALRYHHVAGDPSNSRRRIPGPTPAAWLDRCWGPYRSGSVILRQRAGGGFWCPTNDGIRLRLTPAAETELVSTRDFARVSGYLLVQVPHQLSDFTVSLIQADEDVWQMTADVHHSAVSLTFQPGGAEEAAQLSAGRRLRVAITPAPATSSDLNAGLVNAAVPPTATTGVRLSLVASAGSQIAFDASHLSVGTAG